jgi:lysozyme family protein
MANFIEAYNITLGHEGGYGNDPVDVGGETYKGIARNYHPSWSGWRIIDALKTQPGFPGTAYNDVTLDKSVKEFYKMYYWDVNLLDRVTDQKIANEMFDTGVNMGTGRAAKFLQAALNLLNKNGQIYDDIVEDGKIGPNTLRALGACLAYRGNEYLYKIMNILQGNHYIEYMTKSPTQEKFAYGWLKRVEFIKN